jgi:hypothetical protein
MSRAKNIVIEFRWAERVDRLPDLVAELVRMNVDVIFAPLRMSLGLPEDCQQIGFAGFMVNFAVAAKNLSEGRAEWTART